MHLKTSNAAVILAALALALASTGCARHRHHHHPAPVVVEKGRAGPPAHAPAHGYRTKHGEGHVELVFDSRLGVHVVVGHPDHYHHGSHYYKRTRDHWYVSSRINGGWAVVKVDRLPKALRKAARHAHKKGHRHPHPAKHGY